MADNKSTPNPQGIRRAIIDARLRFLADAEPLLKDRPDLRHEAAALSNAIGDISPADALDGLRRIALERPGGQPADDSGSLFS